MRNSLMIATAVGLGLMLTGVGCGHKTDASNELEKAAKAMEQADAAPAQPAAPVPVPAPAQARPQAAAPAPVAPAQEMHQAITAYKSGNLDDAVMRLQKLRSQVVRSPQQLMALNEAMAAVMGEIYTRAAQGDAKAKQAVKQYEAMQNARRN